MSVPPQPATGAEPPVRALRDDGSWVAYRRLPVDGERVVVTSAAGRFLLAGLEEIHAFERAQAGDERTRELTALGFVRPPLEGASGAFAARVADTPMRHVLLVTGRSGNESMPVATALAAVDRALEASPLGADIEMRGGDLLSDNEVVRAVVDRARERGGDRARLSLWTRMHAAAPYGCDHLVANDVAITLELDASPGANDEGPFPGAVARTALRELHAAYADRGIDRVEAYVNGALDVTRAAALAGARRVVDGCVDAGLVYVQARPAPAETSRCTAEELAGFYGAMIDRVLEVNVGGALLVDKRLALYLETLVAGARPDGTAAPSEWWTLTYEPDGGVHVGDPNHVFAEEEAIGSVDTADGGALSAGAAIRRSELARARARSSVPERSCSACAYEPYCSAPILAQYLHDGAAYEKRFGTRWCATSMATLDDVFARLASPAGLGLRRVFGEWMRARDRVERRARSRAR